MQISQMFKRKPCVFSIECFPPCLLYTSDAADDS